MIANKWRAGSGENTILGSENISDIDTVSFQRIVDPLDVLLTDYKKGCKLTYGSATTVTVGIGQVVCEESGAVNKEMREVTSAVTVDITSDLDTGSEASSTKYYVYAVGDADATTFTCKMSTSSTSPSGLTCFRLLGEFRNGTDGHIDAASVLSYGTDHMAEPQAVFGSWATAHEGTGYADDTTYQAATDGFLVVYASTANPISILTDSSTPPTTIRGIIQADEGTVTMPVKKGDYWLVTTTGSATQEIYWMPLKG